MRTASDAIEWYRSRSGTAEQPNGSNCVPGLTDWYGMGCVPWCAITVSRMLCDIGFGTPDAIDVPGLATTTGKGWAYVPYVRRNFEDAGRYNRDPGSGEPGDLVIFDWDKDGVGDHIGIVESRLSDGTYLCLEGNTSANLLHQRRRPAHLIAGFCKVPYDGLGGPAVAPPSTVLGAFPPWPGRYLRYPPLTVGEDVRRWQGRMQSRGWAIHVDGAYGPASREIARKFQREKNLEADGIVGSLTWTAAWTMPTT